MSESWFAAADASVAHAFMDRGWFRSLCGALRWTAALEPASTHDLCRDCELLASSVAPRPVAPVRHHDAAAKRSAIARAVARRRWRRTN